MYLFARKCCCFPSKTHGRDKLTTIINLIDLIVTPHAVGVSGTHNLNVFLFVIKPNFCVIFKFVMQVHVGCMISG